MRLGVVHALGLGFITTDCTGYATSRLGDDSGRTLNSLRRLCGVCVRVWGGGGALPPEGGIHLSLPYTSHPSPLGRLAILSIAFLPALAMCTTWNSCLSPASLLLLGALFFVSQYPSGLSRPSLWCTGRRRHES